MRSGRCVRDDGAGRVEKGSLARGGGKCGDGCDDAAVFAFLIVSVFGGLWDGQSITCLLAATGSWCRKLCRKLLPMGKWRIDGRLGTVHQWICMQLLRSADALAACGGGGVCFLIDIKV